MTYRSAANGFKAINADFGTGLMVWQDYPLLKRAKAWVAAFICLTDHGCALGLQAKQRKLADSAMESRQIAGACKSYVQSRVVLGLPCAQEFDQAVGTTIILQLIFLCVSTYLSTYVIQVFGIF
ncbi:hypothetical protein [uncultured Cohaesibacter sp.]|uniref:hypothetical protein n=1 Tax=uncultured Cohaesibacter sp. TaxID=1002546 RepID=UPI002AABCC3A|nr:hypothetical protein [uncultured Cohaesibacter sp.]